MKTNAVYSCFQPPILSRDADTNHMKRTYLEQSLTFQLIVVNTRRRINDTGNTMKGTRGEIERLRGTY